jgi:hypothetical protein
MFGVPNQNSLEQMEQCGFLDDGDYCGGDEDKTVCCTAGGSNK